MEYYIYTTYNCNLSCSYCSANKVVNKKHEKLFKLSDKNIKDITNYINADVIKRNNGSNSIVFFGGEPTLVPNEIKHLITNTEDLNLKYVLYTNGYALNSFPKDILKKMNIVFVSIDGNRKTHEKYRGIGTYETIISNVNHIKSFYKNHLIARLTLEEDVPLYDSVINLLDTFDSVHWQIVNKPKFNHPRKFLNNYKSDIEKLFEYWFSEFKNNGIVLKIIPFQGILHSLLFKSDKKYTKKLSFRCRTGLDFQVIDLLGNIYQCDEFVGDLKKRIGNINNKKHPELNYKSHKDIFGDCEICDISDICLGRCRKCLEDYEIQQKRNYCKLTKTLIEIILNYLPEIEEIVKKRKLKPKQIFNQPCYNFEIIP